jgi:hypothetical protein
MARAVGPPVVSLNRRDDGAPLRLRRALGLGEASSAGLGLGVGSL